MVAVQQHGGAAAVTGPLRRRGVDDGRVVGGDGVHRLLQLEAVIHRRGAQRVFAAAAQRAFPIVPAGVVGQIAVVGVIQVPAQVAIGGEGGLKKQPLPGRAIKGVSGRAAAGVERADGVGVDRQRRGGLAQIKQAEGETVHLLRRAERHRVVARHQPDHPRALETVVPAQVAVAHLGAARPGQVPVRVGIGRDRLRIKVHRGVLRQREIEHRAATAAGQRERGGAAQRQRRAAGQRWRRRVAVRRDLEAVAVGLGAEVFALHQQGVAAGGGQRQVVGGLKIPWVSDTPAVRVEQHEVRVGAGIGAQRRQVDVVAGQGIEGIDLFRVAG